MVEVRQLLRRLGYQVRSVSLFVDLVRCLINCGDSVVVVLELPASTRSEAVGDPSLRSDEA